MTIRSILLTAAVLASLSHSAVAEQNLSKRATVDPDVTVDVSNVQGSVTVTVWDRNEVELTAHLESDKDRLEFDASEREVRIEVERPDRHRYRSEDDATLTLKVPKGARLNVETVSADITVDGVRGEQRLESVSGAVETKAYDERLSLHAVSGEISVAGSGGKAALKTENVSGTTIVSGIRGVYEGATVSGRIDASITAADRLHVETVSGEADITAELTPSARVEMESVSGSLSLVIKPPVNAEFEIESFSGDIDTCFGAKPRDKSRYGPGSELDFTQGTGGPRVVIESLSGDIRICDR
ncbi:MAG: DUF4097 family beta strand repeat-containing protein [Steroidobacteraceae bacterium]